ncbi:MAG: amidohydrolase family protein [Methanocellales archaeon]|nr:amidohydrolase family protein [Methanocellales archaeon]MDD3420824.1 amidohydrolase family protein [Methanocellales archaeon]MDD5446363.1 amidohydrolase family protein [Methanocellales archaeon]
MIHEHIISGSIIYGDDFDVMEGYLVIKDGIVSEVATGEVDSFLKGIIAPAFINAHTHIGDSVAKDVNFDSLEALVSPGGLKHKILSETPKDELVSSMRSSLLDMRCCGTAAFADFREGGVTGVLALKEACIRGVKPIILGRPDGDVERVLKITDGIGMSSTNDHPWDYLEMLAELTRKKDKLFAIHAGEANSADIDDALKLDPDFLVHLTYADRKNLKTVADKNIPVVVCPRSNFVTGVGCSWTRPPIERMIELGITVAIGTDNVMLNSVNMFSEIEFVAKAFLRDDRQVFTLCTLNGAKALGLDAWVGSIVEGKTAHIMIVDGESNNMKGVKNPISGIVRRARPDDIIAVIGGEDIYTQNDHNRQEVCG